MPLTPRQARFVQEYLIDLNATQAAIRAGYSPRGATVRGSELLANRKVSAAVAEGQAKYAKRAEMSVEEWRARVVRAIRADIRSVTDPETGALVPLNELDDLGAAAVTGVKVMREKTRIRGEGETVEESLVEVKLTDRLRALELYGKHSGWLKDQVDHSGVIGIAAFDPAKIARASDQELAAMTEGARIAARLLAGEKKPTR